MKREKYAEDIVDSILDFMIEFLKETIGERDEYYSEMDNPMDMSQSQMTNNANGVEPSPLVLIFDTVYMMDEASWKLLDLVKEECTKIAVILLV